MSRSTLSATDALDSQKRWVPGNAPAGHRPVVFGRRFSLSAEPHFLSLSSSKKEERAGERRRFFINFPSLRLSPRSFLAGRERQNAAGVLRAEHKCSQTRAPLVAASPRWAVPQSCTLPNVVEPRRVGTMRRSADYKSAIRQIENLRYDKHDRLILRASRRRIWRPMLEAGSVTLSPDQGGPISRDRAGARDDWLLHRRSPSP